MILSHFAGRMAAPIVYRFSTQKTIVSGLYFFYHRTQSSQRRSNFHAADAILENVYIKID